MCCGALSQGSKVLAVSKDPLGPKEHARTYFAQVGAPGSSLSSLWALLADVLGRMLNAEALGPRRVREGAFQFRIRWFPQG